MKVTCLQENLSRGLGIVGRAVASRTTLPITNNVLLATDGGRLKLVATNLEVAIVHWIGAKVEQEGSITVPARVLGEVVSSLPSGGDNWLVEATTLKSVAGPAVNDRSDPSTSANPSSVNVRSNKLAIGMGGPSGIVMLNAMNFVLPSGVFNSASITSKVTAGERYRSVSLWKLPERT